MSYPLTSSARNGLIVLAALFAGHSAFAVTISKTEYMAGKTRIAADYKADKAGCASSSGNALDICQEVAKAKDKVALAELQFSYTGARKDQDKIVSVKADATYAVAKERCDDKADNDKDVCVKQAKAAHTKTLADLKLEQKVSTAHTDASADKREADYKVANEKCQALAGDAKANCVSVAKAQAGKT